MGAIMTHLDPWIQLTALLRREQENCQGLLDILMEEESALQALDQQKLASIHERQERILHRMAADQRERNARLRDLAGASWQGNLLTWLSKTPSPQAATAQAALRDLVAVGRRVQDVRERNAALSARGLHIVREAIGVIYAGRGIQPVYKESGALNFPSLTTSLDLQG